MFHRDSHNWYAIYRHEIKQDPRPFQTQPVPISSYQLLTLPDNEDQGDCLLLELSLRRLLTPAFFFVFDFTWVCVCGFATVDKMQCQYPSKLFLSFHREKWTASNMTAGSHICCSRGSFTCSHLLCPLSLLLTTAVDLVVFAWIWKIPCFFNL